MYDQYIHMCMHVPSPQIALVKWTESVGLTLIDRDLSSMTTEGPGGERDIYHILQLFPFTSERKRMGVILRVRPGEMFNTSGELHSLPIASFVIYTCMCSVYCAHMHVCMLYMNESWGVNTKYNIMWTLSYVLYAYKPRATL